MYVLSSSSHLYKPINSLVLYLMISYNHTAYANLQAENSHQASLLVCKDAYKELGGTYKIYRIVFIIRICKNHNIENIWLTNTGKWRNTPPKWAENIGL
jgi:hypothetical protein